jgi:hypothetical protein
LTDKEFELLELDLLTYFEYKYDIPKSLEFDNEHFYPIYEWLGDKNIRYIHNYGGRGSGKSYEGGKICVVLLSCLPYCRILGIRQIQRTIKTSLYQEVVDYIDEWGLNNEFKITRSPLHIQHIESGNYMTFSGMDKPLSIKSKKDITHAIYEEFSQIVNKVGVGTVDKSIRTPKTDNHKIIYIYNPDDETHFINDVAHKEKSAEKYKHVRSKTKILHSTYQNNKFISYDFIKLIESEKISDPERYRVDGQGLWGRLKLEGLYYSKFNTEYKSEIKGLYEEVYRPEIPLHITFDFNVYPYISCIINVLDYNKQTNEIRLCTIDEICLKADNVELYETMHEFINRYKRHIGNIFVYGDRSGHNRKIQGFTDFATIFDCLKPTPQQRYIKGNDDSGRQQMIDPFPDYVEQECQFKVIDATNRSENYSLVGRKLFWRRIHSGQEIVLPADVKYGTINSTKHKRQLSEQYPNAKILHLVDADRCPKILKDMYEVQEDAVTGGKNNRNKELTHTSDALDYCGVKIFFAEFNEILAKLKY